MPNNEHIDEVITSIRGEHERTKKHDVGFNMSGWMQSSAVEGDKTGRSCGTVACIAGHATILAYKKFSPSTISARFAWTNGFEEKGREYLGLDENQADDLFYARFSGAQLEEIQPEHAIEVLEHLKATGQVDWTIVRHHYSND